MHAILRVIQNMATDGLVFKLFGKLQHNHQASVAVCLMFTLIAALLAGILDMGHLIKLLSMGTLMMFLAISVAIVLVRYVRVRGLILKCAVAVLLMQLYKQLLQVYTDRLGEQCSKWNAERV